MIPGKPSQQEVTEQSIRKERDAKRKLIFMWSPNICSRVLNNECVGGYFLILGYEILRTSQVAPVEKEPTCQCRWCKRWGLDPWVGKIPWKKAQQSLQYSCSENSMGRGVWWAIVHGVSKSWTWLKQLSLSLFKVWEERVAEGLIDQEKWLFLTKQKAS